MGQNNQASMSQQQAELRRRTLTMLAERGLLAPGTAKGLEEPLTIYHQPAWRGIAPGHEPQALMDSSTRQRDLVALAHATPAAAADLCAAWIERVFVRMGLGVVTGDAAALYHDWCRLSDPRDLHVGMIVAVPAHPYGNGGRSWGHVGLYMGDGYVRHCNNGRVSTAPLEAWLSVYGVMAEPRWGWLGGIALG